MTIPTVKFLHTPQSPLETVFNNLQGGRKSMRLAWMPLLVTPIEQKYSNATKWDMDQLLSYVFLFCHL